MVMLEMKVVVHQRISWSFPLVLGVSIANIVRRSDLFRSSTPEITSRGLLILSP